MLSVLTKQERSCITQLKNKLAVLYSLKIKIMNNMYKHKNIRTQYLINNSNNKNVHTMNNDMIACKK